MRELWVMLFTAMCALALGAEPAAFESLRYNEGWSLLQDSSQQADWLDSVKFVPLHGTNVYISLGGEARLKYERYDQPVFNQTPADNDGFLLQRYLLHADFHATRYFRVFGQL